MKSAVSEVKAAKSEFALNYFEEMMSYETDCWDVHDALNNDKQDFVLLDVRGPALYEKGHINGALNLPHGKIIERKMKEWPDDTLFVVYCAGPHCNGAMRAAIRLAKLNRAVKTMPGGITGWIDEGFDLIKG
ncbi:rhodanese-like domain-containing protein [Curvivirga aplysinae]|uniref:rhodanese-like domain-containing protein n=1 Tax=Curvivirga aplysinae TaxID=2529852 RepID=UPI0012BBC15D|nr:rhodanese-like domain-containing protein [Curvivirga aplysinae]MTI08235.1 rhodanese-like domain-containing protein [Curvivirga aplysinae]